MNSMETAYEQAQKYADNALKMMAEHKVAPTPVNFTVWYQYISFANFELVDEMDKAITGKVQFDEGMHNYLYNKYIQEKNSFNTDLHQNTKRLLSQVLGAISQFTGDTAEYAQQMDSHIQTLEKSGDEESLSGLVEQILNTARTIKSGSDTLTERLNTSRAEMDKLKQNLAQATQEAQRDFLTGIFNRNALEKMLDELTAISSQQDTPLSLLMIDIDHFKKYNDTFGHLIGDEVLKSVAKSLTDSLKGKDIVARYGGEEFCVLLPCTEVENASIVAENIRKLIASKELKRRDTMELIGRVTVSIGVAEFRPHSDTVPVFLKRADEALYASKRNGRNRVTIHDTTAAA